MAARDEIRLALTSADEVVWEITEGLIPYPDAMARMDAHVDAIARGTEPERVWLLEHPPLYTAGTSAHEDDLVERVRRTGAREVILALAATVDGQTTAHYVGECLSGLGVSVSRLSHGVPVGGELELLDDGTLLAALASRRAV